MKNKRMMESREKMNYTQGEVASLIGCSQSMVALIEAGKRDPNKELKVKLASLFKVSVEWLFYEQINDFESYENASIA